MSQQTTTISLPDTRSAPAASTATSLGFVFAVVAAVGFSFKAILVKLAYRHGVDAETLLALRMAFSLPFFLALAWLSERRATQPLAGRDWMSLAALGLFGYYLASYLDFLGLQTITASLERLILFSYPTLVIVISACLFGKPITRRTLVALGLCYSGLALAVTHDLSIAGEFGPLLTGSLLVFASALAYAIYLLGNGHVIHRLGSGRVTAFASGFACLLAIGQFFLMRPVSALAQPWPVYGLALGMAVFSTVLPVWCLSEAIRRLGAGPVALSGNLGPIITLFLGWLLLDEVMGPAQLAGAALVIAGVWAIARR